MSEIKILHLSDLHYDSSRPKDTQIILDALWRDLDNFKDIDFILFSGDLVKAGDRKNDFEKAFQTFINPLLEKTRLNISDFFITPGNHDIQLSKINRVIEKGLQEVLTDRESLNEFLDEEMKNGFENIERLEQFNDFKTRFSAEYIVNSNKLFSTYIAEKENVKIGLACLNSCWRATGAPDDGDRGKLLIGERQIETALTDIKNCDIKIALYHHPLDCLTEYDQGDAEKRLSREFDFLFCGHLHNSNLKLVQNFESKTFLIQGGCLNKGRRHYNGYSVLCYDVQKGSLTIYLRTYFDDRMVFDKGINKFETGEFHTSLLPKKLHIPQLTPAEVPKVTKNGILSSQVHDFKNKYYVSRFTNDPTLDNYTYGKVPNFDRDLQVAMLVNLPTFTKDAKIRILDLGCGPGVIGIELAKRYPFADIYFLDNSMAMLNQCQEKINEFFKEEEAGRFEKNRRELKIIEADLTGHWWEKIIERPIHYIYSAQTLHHFSSDVKQKIFEKAIKLLYNKGLFLISDRIEMPRENFSVHRNNWNIQFKNRGKTELQTSYSYNDFHHEEVNRNDIPSSLTEQLSWLKKNGLFAEIFWLYSNRAVFGGQLLLGPSKGE